MDQNLQPMCAAHNIHESSQSVTVLCLSRQYKDREGETGARQATRHDPHGDHRSWNRRGDGERASSLPAPDVRGGSWNQAFWSDNICTERNNPDCFIHCSEPGPKTIAGVVWSNSWTLRNVSCNVIWHGRRWTPSMMHISGQLPFVFTLQSCNKLVDKSCCKLSKFSLKCECFLMPLLLQAPPPQGRIRDKFLDLSIFNIKPSRFQTQIWNCGVFYLLQPSHL